MKSTKDFVAIDFETLQAIADDGRMYNKLPIQVGMIKYMNGKEVERYDTYICPPVSYEWESHWKIGIDWQDCKKAPSYDSIHRQIMDFISNLPLVAFNASSEWYALADACSYYHLELPSNGRTATRQNTPPAGKSFLNISSLLSACRQETTETAYPKPTNR